MKGSRAGLRSGARRVVLLGTIAAGLLFLPSALVSPESASGYDVGPPVGKVPVHETMAKAALDLYGVQFFNKVEDGIRHEDGEDHVYGLNLDVPLVGKPLVTASHFWVADKGPTERDEERRGAQDRRAADPRAVRDALPEQRPHLRERVAEGERALVARTRRVRERQQARGVPLPRPRRPSARGPDGPGACPRRPARADLVRRRLVSRVDGHRGRSAAAREPFRRREGVPQEARVSIDPDSPDKLHWLFYTTQQVGDFFASDDVDGNTDDPLGLAIQDDVYKKMVNDPSLTRLRFRTRALRQRRLLLPASSGLRQRQRRRRRPDDDPQVHVPPRYPRRRRAVQAVRADGSAAGHARRRDPARRTGRVARLLPVPVPHRIRREALRRDLQCRLLCSCDDCRAPVAKSRRARGKQGRHRHELAVRQLGSAQAAAFR